MARSERTSAHTRSASRVTPLNTKYAVRQRPILRVTLTVPPAPVNALLSAVLALESWWLRRLDNPFGSSLLCLARKRE